MTEEQLEVHFCRDTRKLLLFWRFSKVFVCKSPILIVALLASRFKIAFPRNLLVFNFFVSVIERSFFAAVNGCFIIPGGADLQSVLSFFDCHK